MNSKIILIKSTDNTDTIVFVDKIQYICQRKEGVEIGLRDNTTITTNAEFNSVLNAVTEALEKQL